MKAFNHIWGEGINLGGTSKIYFDTETGSMSYDIGDVSGLISDEEFEKLIEIYNSNKDGQYKSKKDTHPQTIREYNRKKKVSLEAALEFCDDEAYVNSGFEKWWIRQNLNLKDYELSKIAALEFCDGDFSPKRFKEWFLRFVEKNKDFMYESNTTKITRFNNFK